MLAASAEHQVHGARARIDHLAFELEHAHRLLQRGDALLLGNDVSDGEGDDQVHQLPGEHLARLWHAFGNRVQLVIDEAERGLLDITLHLIANQVHAQLVALDRHHRKQRVQVVAAWHRICRNPAAYPRSGNHLADALHIAEQGIDERIRRPAVRVYRGWPWHLCDQFLTVGKQPLNHWRQLTPVTAETTHRRIGLIHDAFDGQVHPALMQAACGVLHLQARPRFLEPEQEAVPCSVHGKIRLSC